MANERILFIEDDPSGREMVTFNLEKAGFEVDAVDSGEAGLETFDAQKHSLVITDVRMPGITGMDVLREIKKKAPETPVLIITAYANIDMAVSAMKAGAFDFVGKPFNRAHLLLTVKKALENRALIREVRSLRLRAGGVERAIIYGSPAMRRVLDVVDRVAPSNATILVTGESGTGKELIARRIHVKSSRAQGPFVATNVAAMPTELLESELFGHEKGAFTGAVRTREGRFRHADGGTLFLDEISELPLELQGKLLRALQEGTVDVIGADKPVKVDVRVVAATNRDLLEEVRQGRFREDLFYRLNVVEIKIPPLRARPEDIEPLVEHFVGIYSAGEAPNVPDDLLARLRSMSWPGNVRELQNTCQRLVLLGRGDELSVDDLPPDFSKPDADEVGLNKASLEKWPALPKDGLSLIDLERSVIERVLELKGGNVSQAALYLKIPRHVLAYRMEKYGIAKKS